MRERAQIIGKVAERPLEVSLEWGQGWLTWSLGPYARGKYFLMSGDTAGAYSAVTEVTQQGARSYHVEGFVRVGYESQDGWIALSPEFFVDLMEPGRFVWSRPLRSMYQ